MWCVCVLFAAFQNRQARQAKAVDLACLLIFSCFALHALLACRQLICIGNPSVVVGRCCDSEVGGGKESCLLRRSMLSAML